MAQDTATLHVYRYISDDARMYDPVEVARDNWEPRVIRQAEAVGGKTDDLMEAAGLVDVSDLNGITRTETFLTKRALNYLCRKLKLKVSKEQ